MKKMLLVTALGLASGSALAVDLDGGQLEISGLVSANTCKTSVDNGGPDGLITLDLATVDEIIAAQEVKDTEAGAKPKGFSISVDCSQTTPSPGNTATLRMGSSFFSNSHGTLNNDTTINQPASGVTVAIHSLDAALAKKQMRVNDSSSFLNGDLTANGKYTWNFVASYVRQNAAINVTSGYVKTKASYTIEYN